MSESAPILTKHIPVLRDEVVEFLRAEQGGEFLDCTFGGGGHSRALLEASPDARVVALDRDPSAQERSMSLKEEFFDRFQFIRGSFGDYCSGSTEQLFDGVLADLGMSTDQLHARRGFSLRDDAPLDMRMDAEGALTADEIVNRYPLPKLVRTLKQGGVGSEAAHFSKVILSKRPIPTAKKLAEILEAAAPRKMREKSSHPATVVFQALRIAVNSELEQLEALLEGLPRLVKKGGRVAIITFHSLEDRFVAKRMRQWAAGETAPAWWPTTPGRQSIGRLLTKKAVVPSESEVSANPASRSAGLRVFEFKGE